jgi:CrcB protein
MSLWLWIGVGGFLGAILRYYISGWIQGGLIHFPLGTLGVNFIGSLLLSLILYSSEYKGWFDPEIRIFLTVGLLGSFTTMSTFSYESIKLLEEEEIFLFGINIISTLALTFLAIYLGKILVTNLGLK